MEFIAPLMSFLSDKTPEFIAGYAMGGLSAWLLLQFVLLPRMVKNATSQMTTQITILTSHIQTLEAQVNTLEEKLAPYEKLAGEQLKKALSFDNPIKSQ